MRTATSVVLLIVLAVFVAGCGGSGSTTTVIERTVTVESNAKSGKTRNSGPQVEVSEDGSQVRLQEGVDESEATSTAGENAQGPNRTVHLHAFQNPSGNIGCEMVEGGARCDIRKREWSPPLRPAGCSNQVDFGRGLGVANGGHANFICAGESALDSGASVLAFGTASEVGGAECTSSSAGISCVNQAGHGFFISNKSYEIF